MLYNADDEPGNEAERKVKDELIAEAGEHLIDRMMAGEPIRWYDKHSQEIDLNAVPRNRTDLAITVPVYYDWPMLKLHGLKLIADEAAAGRHHGLALRSLLTDLSLSPSVDVS